MGLTHYTILPLPNELRVYTKKRRIYLLSKTTSCLKIFMSNLRRIRKIDIYKGKGLSEVKNYKGFIKMKSGKRKQY